MNQPMLKLKPQTAEQMEQALAERKATEMVERAKVHVQVYHPFFGALISRLKMKCDPRHPTMYTDAVVIGFNPHFVLALRWEEVLFIILHEVMHCALRHPFRRNGRDAKLWAQAIDHVTNLALLDDPEIAKLRPREESMATAGLADPRFAGLAAEQVFTILKTEQAQEPEENEEQGEGESGGDEGMEGMGGATGEAGDCLDAGASGEEPEELEPEEDDDEQEGESDATGDPQQGEEEEEEGEARAEQPGSSDEGDEGDEDEGDEDEGDDDAQGDGIEGGSSEGKKSASKESGSEQGNAPDAPEQGLSPDQLDRLEREWSEAVSTAALGAGDGIGGDGADARARALGVAGQVRMSFEQYVDAFMQRCMATEPTWRRPNRRYSETYMPASCDPAVRILIAGIDTSASVDSNALKTFEVALAKISEQFNAAKIILVHCDSRIRKVEEFARGEPIVLEAAGGGGTLFEPVFRFALDLIEQGEEVAGVIYLTDLEGSCANDHLYRDIETLWVGTELPKGMMTFGAQHQAFGQVCSIHD